MRYLCSDIEKEYYVCRHKAHMLDLVDIKYAHSSFDPYWMKGIN